MLLFTQPAVINAELSNVTLGSLIIGGLFETVLLMVGFVGVLFTLDYFKTGFFGVLWFDITHQMPIRTIPNTTTTITGAAFFKSMLFLENGVKK